MNNNNPVLRIQLKGQLAELRQGVAVLAPQLGIELAEDGLPVAVEQIADNRIEVAYRNGAAVIRYPRRIHFFRALGLLIEQLRAGADEFALEETPQFEMNGPMFDVSQGGAVLTTDSVKTFLRHQALMGLDMIMLYAEDSYDVKEQPYFGYMRGRYSQEEIRDLDDYAYQLGIEMIPCIQTLSHLEDVLKWPAFRDIRDDKETMLVGYERTYEFVEQLIVTAMAPMRTKRIHIGMDEAWNLGLGEYLNQNGYHTKFDIMNEHLARVLQITEKHGLTPMMWSDMYFRAGSKKGAYYDRDCVIPDEVIEAMPKGVQQVYWDYYHYDEDFYTDWINRHKKFGSTPVFAGGIWNWRGFVLNYGATFASTNAALNVCKREGVTEIIATLWGDDGTECDWWSALLGLQLFAEHGYAEQLDEEKLKRRFAFCSGGASYDDFMDIRLVDETPGISPGNLETTNVSRSLLWQNPMQGLFDYNIRGYGLGEHYAGLEKKLSLYADRNGDYGFVFELLRRLCDVLALKAEMGIRLTDAYAAGDKGELDRIRTAELPELTVRVKALHKYHRQCWHRTNKTFGWDIMDLRYGGLLLLLDTAVHRLGDYLDGTVATLEELEETRLSFNGKDGPADCYFYQFMPTATRIARV
ncbi:beta-N-acetylhexosaminidase [Paenibacillus koleovorans]|uniref:beta-N-acetylhexosaminidase n=1 Tax=Paenibacillus koleovorans TaxID=121608 RepID=UPI0013E3EE8D|nr:beta-N-acetylhexosaminidase [Paenibacillus koleovorans]